MKIYVVSVLPSGFNIPKSGIAVAACSNRAAAEEISNYIEDHSFIDELELDAFKLNVKTEYYISIDIDGNIVFNYEKPLHRKYACREESHRSISGSKSFFNGVSYESKERAIELALAERDKYAASLHD